MSIRIKHGSVIDLTYRPGILERIYLPALLKGLFITGRHFISAAFFRGKYTTFYPEQKRGIDHRFRGRHFLKRDEQGRERCVACMLCMWNCPVNAITIEAAETPRDEIGRVYRREKHAKTWQMDYNRCIFCGICQEACPEAAIFLESHFNDVVDDRSMLVYQKEQLLERIGGPVKFRD